MRLVNMEVDRNGHQQRMRIGPLSHGLNALCGPDGAGKSTLLAWLRTVAAEEGWQCRPESGLRPMSGMIQLQNQGRQYRISSDRNGRVVVEPADDHSDYVARPRWDGRIDRQVPTNLSARQRRAFLGLAETNDLLDSASALRSLAHRLGLDTEQIGSSSERHELLSRKREVEQRLQRVDNLHASREDLLARQRQLESELATARDAGRKLQYEGQSVEQRRIEERCAVLEDDLNHTLQEIEALDGQLADREKQLKLLDGAPTQPVAASYREQLQQLDDRLNRWRQTLSDLKSHRETIESSATDVRLDKQLGDQLSTTKESDPRAAMRSLESQIMQTRQQLDELVERFSPIPGYDYRTATAAVSGTRFQAGAPKTANGVYRDATGQAYVGHPTHLPESTVLPETLRSMQKDLHEVCQQLSRHEAKSATDTLKQQTLQLNRCEKELEQAIEKLIDERAALLSRIAGEHHMSVEQLTLAFGNWCQCHDHPHLVDWLKSEEGNLQTSAADSGSERPRLIEEIDLLKRNRKQAAIYADNCRRQIRDADLHRRGKLSAEPKSSRRHLSDVQSDLQQVVADLAEMTERDRLQAELEEIQQEIAHSAKPNDSGNSFQRLTDTHIAGLMGPVQSPDRFRSLAERESRRYDLVDGLVSDGLDARYSGQASRPVPKEIVAVAMRLAIGEAMARAGEPIAIVLDGCLDEIAPAIQETAIAYLADIAGSQQQILVLTANKRVGELVRQAYGWVGELQPASSTNDGDLPINSHLTAWANHHEAEKWNQVNTSRVTASPESDFYLHERSLIEDLPAIDPTLAARLRALGVDRIGDLLDVDPTWLAKAMRIEGVSRRTVVAWQAVARLLCSVRHLRPFDARVLVGAGIHSPSQLAAMHPSQLLERVEQFLRTRTGRKILNSGNSYELSRITAWIASAKGGRRRFDRTRNAVHPIEDEAYLISPEASDGGLPVEHGYAEFMESEYDAEHARYDHDRSRYEVTSRDRSSTRRSQRPTRKSAVAARRSAQPYPVVDESGRSHRHWNDQSPRANKALRVTPEDHEADANDHAGDQLKFYLELTSPVVDAPSIGPRMAERLEKHGVETVDQLLTADPEDLAEELNHRRVDAETVNAWQQQALLVCRIPNLRGHDAQLLVACELTTPEEVSEMNPEDLLEIVSEIVDSTEGQRILRGGKEPDLEEITNWIDWAANCRVLKAA